MMDVDSPAPRTQPPELGIGIIGGLLVGIGPIPLARLLDEGRAASLMDACFGLAGDGHRRDRTDSAARTGGTPSGTSCYRHAGIVFLDDDGARQTNTNVPHNCGGTAK